MSYNETYKIINNSTYQQFKVKRALLAEKCASELGIKPLPAVLYEYAINVSELPRIIAKSDRYYRPTSFESLEESSLLSMKMVYHYDGLITIIDTNGSTLLLPDVEVIREELKKCGYIICGLGSWYPEDINPMLLPQYCREIDSLESFDEEEKLKEIKKVCTLSNSLAKKVVSLEAFGSHVSDYIINSDNEFSYDIFDSSFYKGGQCSNAYSSEAIHYLDLSSKNSRKFLANFYSNPSYVELGSISDSLESFVEQTCNNSVLNDEIYYSNGGLYSVLTGNQIYSEDDVTMKLS